MGTGREEDVLWPVKPRTMIAKRAWMARRAMIIMSSILDGLSRGLDVD